jgi:ATP/maltotriose-dependent transcriptional regulator MalT
LLQGKKAVPAEPMRPLTSEAMRALGISARELDVLQLMANGLSNQGIADKLFISLATVKSHSSSLFGKLEVRSRTQAVLYAKAADIIP